MSFEHQYATSY